ncbi:PAS domain S-box protein [bacterium]|nr:PAS domain S-box protein [candidate division CSSED10-310 bacterium]
MPVACSLVRNDGTILFLNKAMEDITGHEFSATPDLESWVLLMLANESHRDAAIRSINRILSGGRPDISQFSIRCKDGTIKQVEIKVTMFDDMHLAQLFDVTRREQLVEELSLSKKHYKMLFELAPMGILTADRQGRILAVNDKLLKILGSPSSSDTMNINVLTYPPLIEAGVSGEFRRCLESGQQSVSEHPYTSKWGKNSHLLYHLSPIPVNKGEVGGVLAMVEDLTERIRLRESLDKNRKLATIGQAISTIAHCMKNIHLVLDGGLHLMEEALQNNELYAAEEALRLLHRSSVRLYLLLMNMLDYTRRRPIIKKHIQIEALFDEVLQQLQHSAVRKYLTLMKTVEPDAMECYIDPDRLHRILLNLGINAIDATDAGGTITFTAHKSTISTFEPSHDGSPDEVLVISVSDTGCGIAAKQLTQIFKPFYSTKGTKGTGLGLTSSRQLIEEQGGRMYVTSKEGEGSTFSIVLF